METLRAALLACGTPQQAVFAPVWRDSGGTQAARRGLPLCDLLAVKPPHVLLAFCRRSGSLPRLLERLRGAEDWLAHFSRRLYLGPDCEEPLPLDLPPPSRRILHRLIVIGQLPDEGLPPAPGVRVLTLHQLPQRLSRGLWETP